MHPVHGEVPPLRLGFLNELAAQPGPRRLRRHRLRFENPQVADHPLHLPALQEQVEQAALPVNGVVGQVQLAHPARPEAQPVLRPVAFQQLVPGDPVHLPRHDAKPRLPVASVPVRSTKLCTRSTYSRWISNALASRPLARRTLRRPVISWLISRIARIGFSNVKSRMGTFASIMRNTKSVEA